MADKTDRHKADDDTLLKILHKDLGSGVYAPAVVPVDSAGAPLFSTRRLAADNLALPTAQDVLAVLMGYDGATLDMLRSGAGSGTVGVLQVLLKNNSGNILDAQSADGDDISRKITVALAGLNASATYDRLRSGAADGTIGVLRTISFAGSGRYYDDSVNIVDAVSGVRQYPTTPSLWSGAAYDRQRTPAVFTNVALGAATAETTAWTPTSAKKFRLMGFVLTASAQTVLTFKDNTGGTTIFTVELAANVPLHIMLGNGKLSAAANNLLTVTRGTSATLNGTLIGTEE